jgi:hypothetical protein
MRVKLEANVGRAGVGGGGNEILWFVQTESREVTKSQATGRVTSHKSRLHTYMYYKRRTTATAREKELSVWSLVNLRQGLQKLVS